MPDIQNETNKPQNNFSVVQQEIVPDDDLTTPHEPEEPELEPAPEVVPDEPERNEITLKLQNGFGDTVHAAFFLSLWKNRGHTVRVTYDKKYKIIFDAAGIEFENNKKDWPAFEIRYRHEHCDISQPEWISNHIAYTLENQILPTIGTTESLWNELCQVRLDVMPFVTQEDMDRVFRGLRRVIERPIIVWSTQGVSYKQKKNLDKKTATEAMRLTTEKMIQANLGDPVFVLLDMNHQEPVAKGSTTLHLRNVMGGGSNHSTLGSLAALYSIAKIVVGVDSGPFHFASLTPAKALGIFRKMPAVSCCIPNPNSTYLVPAKDHDRWLERPSCWNFREYPGEEPTGEDISNAIMEILNGQNEKKEIIESASDVSEIPNERDPVFSRSEEVHNNLLVQQLETRT